MKYKKAFLLFEVLIAILIASTTLVVLMQGLGNALKGSNVVERYFKANTLAETYFAMLEKEIGVKPGISNGRFDKEEDPEGMFLWEQDVTQIIIPTLFGITELPICEVKLTIKWKEGLGERQVEYVTYLPKYEESPSER